jgi:hypothetical protein
MGGDNGFPISTMLAAMNSFFRKTVRIRDKARAKLHAFAYTAPAAILFFIIFRKIPCIRIAKINIIIAIC